MVLSNQNTLGEAQKHNIAMDVGHIQVEKGEHSSSEEEGPIELTI